VKIARARFRVPTALGNTLDQVTLEDGAGNTRVVQALSWTHATLMIAAAGHTEVDIGDDDRLTIVATFPDGTPGDDARGAPAVTAPPAPRPRRRRR
jgi:hypothetical protein